MSDDKKTVTVGCSHPGGLRVQIGPIDGQPDVPRECVLNGPAGAGVASGLSNPTPALAPGTTEVDPRFWAAYVKQHEKAPGSLLANGTVFEVKPGGEPKEDGTLPEDAADRPTE